MRFSLLAISLALAWLMPQPAMAQSSPKGFRHLEVYTGLGLLPTFAMDRIRSIHPPLLAGVRYRFNDRMSLGLQAGQSTASTVRTLSQGLVQTFRNRFSTIMLRGAAHSRRWERWEVYGGLALGLSFNEGTYTYELTDTLDQAAGEVLRPRWRNGLFLTAFLGSSFSPRPRVHLFGELGFGLSFLTTGLSYRL
jgi:hypothetical protein